MSDQTKQVPVRFPAEMYEQLVIVSAAAERNVSQTVRFYCRLGLAMDFMLAGGGHPTVAEYLEKLEHRRETIKPYLHVGYEDDPEVAIALDANEGAGVLIIPPEPGQ